MRRFDAYIKADATVQEKSYTGAVITLVSSLFMILLFRSEYNSYRQIRIADHMLIDPAFGAQTIPVNMAISFLKLKCSDVNIDIDDRSGHHDLHVSDDMQKIPYVHAQDFDLDPGKYRGEKLMKANAPGCTVKGKFNIRKVAGNFHVALGSNLLANAKGVTHTSDQPKYRFSVGDIAHYNSSHIIHHIDFGATGKLADLGLENYPLDNITKILPGSAKTAQYQYFLQIVPTEYVTVSGTSRYSHQFSYTEHARIVSSTGAVFVQNFPHPGVFFKYDFSPIMVKFSEERMTFMNFATTVCAIIGGVFTCAGLMTRCCIGSIDVISKLD
jgi:hypothetical protein